MDIPDLADKQPELRVGRALHFFAAYLGAQVLAVVGLGVLAGIYFVSVGGKISDQAALLKFQLSLEAPLSTAGLICGVLALIYMAKRLPPELLYSQSSAGVAWVAGSFRQILLGILLGIVLIAVFVLVCVVYAQQKGMADVPKGPLAQMATASFFSRCCWAAIGLLAPMAEEFLFRGVAYAAFTKTFGRAVGFLMPTILFIALHLGEVKGFWPALVSISFLAIGTLCLRIRYGALGPAAAMHFTYNFTIVLLVLFGQALLGS